MFVIVRDGADGLWVLLISQTMSSYSQQGKYLHRPQRLVVVQHFTASGAIVSSSGSDCKLTRLCSCIKVWDSLHKQYHGYGATEKHSTTMFTV